MLRKSKECLAMEDCLSDISSWNQPVWGEDVRADSLGLALPLKEESTLHALRVDLSGFSKRKLK